MLSLVRNVLTYCWLGKSNREKTQIWRNVLHSYHTRLKRNNRLTPRTLFTRKQWRKLTKIEWHMLTTRLSLWLINLLRNGQRLNMEFSFQLRRTSCPQRWRQTSAHTRLQASLSQSCFCRTLMKFWNAKHHRHYTILGLTT